MLYISVGNPGPSKYFLPLLSLMLQQTVVNMRNRTQYLTVLQFDLCGVQGDKLDHYRKGAVPEQQMFPISYVKGCKNIHQYTPGMGELVLVETENCLDASFIEKIIANKVWSIQANWTLNIGLFITMQTKNKQTKALSLSHCVN